MGPVPVSRRTMLSRVADHLYWMSRYLERAEHAARVLDVHLHLMLESAPSNAEDRWGDVLGALRLSPDHSIPDPDRLLFQLCFDNSDPASIARCISAARDNARQARERVSSEMWEELNRLHLYVQRAQTREQWGVEPHAFFQAAKDGAHLFQGITDSTMSHGQGWQFIQAGRTLERAGSTAALVATFLAGSLDPPADATSWADGYFKWLGLLKSCTAFEAYCKVYSADLEPLEIAEFLLLDPNFPHSVRFSVDCLSRALGAIAAETGVRETRELDWTCGRMGAALAYSPIGELADRLGPFLSQLEDWLDGLHEILFRLYFTEQYLFFA